MKRRSLLLATGARALEAQASPELAALARQGGALLLRHASTEPGFGDPPGFRLGQCSTQRNLSAAGQDQARALGVWFGRHGLQPLAVSGRGAGIVMRGMS